MPEVLNYNGEVHTLSPLPVNGVLISISPAVPRSVGTGWSLQARSLRPRGWREVMELASGRSQALESMRRLLLFAAILVSREKMVFAQARATSGSVRKNSSVSVWIVVFR